MSDSARPKRDKREQSVTYFWRALRYLAPHRRLAIISIGCAFLVGLTFTGGLSAMLPVLRVLMNGETVQVWAGKSVVESRLGVRFADAPDELIVAKVFPNTPAARARLQAGDAIATGPAALDHL